MNAMMKLSLVLVCAALSHGLKAATEEEIQADPAALKAFTELVKSYRERPALTVKSTVKIEMTDGDASASGTEVKGEFVFGQKRRAVIKLRGFTCYLTNDPQKPDSGVVAAVHEGTPDSFYSDSDEGSPYYKLLNDFRDMPFPELAIMLGEEQIDDVLLQFHPKALSGVVPTAVSTVDKEGRTLQVITLTGENETLEVQVNPENRLIQAIEMKISGGAFARPGSTVVYKHTYEYEEHDKPLDDAFFTLKPEMRQRVDIMMALLPQRAPIDAEGDGEGGQHPLIGNPAPPFVLATSEDKAIDLNDLNGQVVVLDFWASWCSPCMAALPRLHEVAKWAAAEDLPVQVLTVNIWEIRDKTKDSPDARLQSVKNTWTKRKFTLPILMDYSDATAAAYKVGGVPMTVVIRSDGVVHNVHVGASPDYVDTLKSDIQDALKAVE